VTATLLLAVAVAVAWFSVGKLIANPASYSGSIQSVGSVDVNFPNTGELVALSVKPGDHVTKGQVVAQLDPTAAQATLQSDKAVVAADQAKLTDLQASSVNSAQQQQLALQVSQAQAQLAEAQQAVKDAQAVAASQLTQAQAQEASALAQYNQDQAAFTAACPGGVTSSAACLSLSSRVQTDSVALSAAKADVQHVQATGQQAVDAANGLVGQSSAALALAQNQGAVQAAPASPADLDAARVALQQAQAQVATDQAALSALTLVSPASGVVTEVSGSVGDLAGPTGVHSFSGPAPPAPNSQQPSFSLFPAPSSAASSNGANSAVQSLLSVQAGGMVAAAQVTENAVPKLSRGQRAHVIVNALGVTVPGRVQKIIPAPVSASSSVSYEVLVTAKSWPRRMLPGMSISVTFG
jgi:multidrug efflux pump subunit AcrA (membrane-fusion protein)